MITILYLVYWVIHYVCTVFMFFYLNYCREYIIGCFIRNNFFVGLWKVIIFYPVYLLILYLLKSVCFFLFGLLYLVCYWLFDKKGFLCMNVTWLLYFIQLIEWFYNCLDICSIFLYLINCSWYAIGCFTRSDFFLWLWNDCYLVSRLFIDSLLALI